MNNNLLRRQKLKLKEPIDQISLAINSDVPTSIQLITNDDEIGYTQSVHIENNTD